VGASSEGLSKIKKSSSFDKLFKTSSSNSDAEGEQRLIIENWKDENDEEEEDAPPQYPFNS